MNEEFITKAQHRIEEAELKKKAIEFGKILGWWETKYGSCFEVSHVVDSRDEWTIVLKSPDFPTTYVHYHWNFGKEKWIKQGLVQKD